MIVSVLLCPLHISQNFSYYSLFFLSEYILVSVDYICIVFKFYWMLYLCFCFSCIFYEVSLYIYIYICVIYLHVFYAYIKLLITQGRKVSLKPSLGQPLNLEANAINLPAYFLT